VTLGIENDRAVWITAKRLYPLSTGFLALVALVVSYLGARLGDTLLLPPQGAGLWPGSAFLLSLLLLIPQKTWPVVVPAGLAGFVLHDLQIGFSPWTIAVFLLGCTIEVLIPAIGLRYSFVGIPRLNSLKALAKYSFFAVLGPFVANFVGAFAIPGRYWTDFRLYVFSDAIAFFIFTPAILSWAGPRSGRNERSSESKLEGAALVSALVLLASVIFFLNWRTPHVSLIYSFVPILVWAALRFGSKGVSTSMIIIAVASVWGSIHGHGPFTGPDPLHNVLSLQPFLVFAAGPFMVLAVVGEDREQARLVERELSKRLISEQERERSRIAGELHDDVCQRLSLLSMEILGASRGENQMGSTKERLEEIRRHCSEIADDVQLLSHELHSAKLDYLGISAAIRGFCREFGKQQEVNIEFTERDVPKSLSRDGSLCLFRVAQEALHNAVKYSGTNLFSVELSGTGNEVRLEVRDAGIGFDVKGANRSGGLGLVSMQERLRAVNGRFCVESKHGAGTKVIASVPVAAGNSAERVIGDDAPNVAGAA
jgi:signal transduction histidine kinase